MGDRAREVYTKRIRARLDALEAKRHAAELRVRAIRRQIEELIVGQSPIGPGDVIEWESGGRSRRGRVLSVYSNYRGFDYRVAIVTKAGRQIGIATVGEGHHPVLVG